MVTRQDGHYLATFELGPIKALPATITSSRPEHRKFRADVSLVARRQWVDLPDRQQYQPRDRPGASIHAAQSLARSEGRRRSLGRSVASLGSRPERTRQS